MKIIPEKATILGWCFVPSWEDKQDFITFSPTIEGAMRIASNEWTHPLHCYLLCRVMQTPRGRFILWARDAEYTLVNFLRGFRGRCHYGPILGLLPNALEKLSRDREAEQIDLIKTLESLWHPTVSELDELQMYFGLKPEDIL